MKGEWTGRWKGQTVVCIASGPSLTEEDCERVKGLPSIVTNTTFRRCLWASLLFGHDAKWWKAGDEETKRLGFKTYAEETAARFQGERLTCAPSGKTFGVPTLYQAKWLEIWPNSGVTAISIAIAAGAKRIVLLGYDCQKTGGLSHWHKDHPVTIGSCKSIKHWPMQFKGVAKLAGRSGVEVINCSRATALTCFPRGELASAL